MFSTAKRCFYQVQNKTASKPFPSQLPQLKAQNLTATTHLFIHPPTTPRKHIPPTTRHHPPSADKLSSRPVSGGFRPKKSTNPHPFRAEDRFLWRRRAHAAKPGGAPPPCGVESFCAAPHRRWSPLGFCVRGQLRRHPCSGPGSRRHPDSGATRHRDHSVPAPCTSSSPQPPLPLHSQPHQQQQETHASSKVLAYIERDQVSPWQICTIRELHCVGR